MLTSIVALQEEWECQEQADPLEEALNEIVNKDHGCRISRFEEQIHHKKTCEQENENEALPE